MSREWTERQKQAVDAKTPLIVPAAAGSGKTAVLVERAMRLICDRTNPADIDELLIVTFTRAAADEMRRRLAGAITERLAQNPADFHMRRQATLIHRAEITTVHGLCSRLLSGYGYLLGLDSFRIGDQNEIKMLESEALEGLLEDYYLEGAPDFAELIEQTSKSRNDKGLEETILSAYSLLRSHPSPEGWLEIKLRDYFDAGRIESGAWAKILKNELALALKYHKSALLTCLEDMEGTPFEGKYSPAFMADIASIERLLEAAQSGWDQLARAVDAVWFERLSGVRGEVDEQLKERLTRRRRAYTSYIKGLQEGIFSAGLNEIKGDLDALSGPVSMLFRLVSEYSKRLADLKNLRGVIWFDDLEHLALRLLCEDMAVKGEEITLKPSPLAERLAGGYREIMVDEYQDINLLQDTIISLLSRGQENLFMVGDIKQSIYRFRMANPDIFAEKYDAARQGEFTAVPLSQNFRSRREILDFSNFIFSRLMQKGMGEIDYDGEASLYPGQNTPDYSPDCRVEIGIVDMKGGGEEEDDEDESPEKAACEAGFAAEKIARMLDSGFLVREGDTLRSSRPEDYVILLRSYQNKAGYYADALAARGIASSLSTPPDYFSAPEIICAMALLEVIENPRQDVWLLSALRAPCFGFSAAELAEIRLKGEGDFYNALIAAGDMPKAVEFLEFLKKFRDISPDLPVAGLLARIYDETHLVGLFSALPGGAARRDNLLFLGEAARRYDLGGGRGLFGFVNYLEASRENGLLASAPLTDKGGGEGVRVMSVHNSKGLEFPIVLVCDLARLFNQDDLKKSLLIHRDLGVGLKRREIGRGIEYTTLPREAIAAKIKNESMSEEMRILYVALTRARDKLVLTMSFRDADKVLTRVISDRGEGPIPPALLQSDRSSGLWVLRALAGRPGLQRLLEEGSLSDDGLEITLNPGGENIKRAGRSVATPPEPGAPDEKIIAEAVLRLGFEYGYKRAAELPSKLTATAIKGGLLEPETAEDTHPRPQPLRPMRPGDEGVSPVERGRAMHLSMQLVKLESCGDIEGARAEIGRLFDKKILTREQYEAGEPEKICSFVNSALGRRALAADYRREFKFSLLVPASGFFEGGELEDEQVLLQGVIDLFFEEEDGLVIVDFKSDRIRSGGEAERAREYTAQLETYALALGRMTGKRIKQRYIWFFETGSGLTV